MSKKLTKEQVDYSIPIVKKGSLLLGYNRTGVITPKRYLFDT